MRLAGHPHFDALCGEYLVGTLRGAARRRFERALLDEPRAADRLAYWQTLAPRYSSMIESQPSPRVWQKLERSIGLERFRTRWYQRAGFWMLATAAALVLALGVSLFQESATEIAVLSGKEPAVTAYLSRDGRTLELRAARPVVAGPRQSYELWVIAQGEKPVSVAVLGSLDARFKVSAERLPAGATLAVSVEPAGGSPTGQPTGPVILAGKITL